ncbi:family 43 glycosylhydrolase [Echinicola jeungdonensis]|uniref:Family 43 glycosylhydrolase n=1 Tax=Echinicola jeungdonensis TaxID=709343 RepID=A0ABV5J8D3_9BACT|nr:family 43 glycosylhydrolase [Echinicola jeungdonensis]MDN3669476.1 family 43 glycosylhydrolase [Echinicola jeungdonensis]
MNPIIPSYHRKAFLCLFLLFVGMVALVARPITEDSTKMDHSILAYVKQGNTERTASLHLAYKPNDQDFVPLNNGKAILYPLLGSRKMGAPHLFEQNEGGYGLVASDNQSGNGVLVYDTQDLIYYSGERLLVLSEEVQVQDPVCQYDEKLEAYRIAWLGSDGEYYVSISKDLETIKETRKTENYQRKNILAALPEGAKDASVFSPDLETYKTLINKFAPIQHTGFEVLEDITLSGEEKIQLILPDEVKARYSDGSTKEMPVFWNQSDLKKLHKAKQGTFEIRGKASQPLFANPFIEQRADPHIIKGSDGYYYFTSSYPMVGGDDPEGYDRVILRRAKTIKGLADAEEVTIWDEKNSNISSRYVWAPEIHEINGTWYVLFTTSSPDAGVWGIRPIIIACNQGDGDPIKPENWEKTGHYCEAVESDEVAFQHFSLDMTYFQHQGKHYVIWAEKPRGSNLRIASINPEQPWKMTSPSVQLSKPEYGWEWKGAQWVNEGPAVIKNGDKVFAAFSAATVDEAYCVSILYADKDADLLDPNNWIKQNYPLLSTDDLDGQKGPGHNSFTIDEYGNPLLVYHARTEGEVSGPGDKGDGGLYDPGRHARIRPVHFAIDGMPVFNMSPKQILDPALNHFTVKVTLKSAE